MVTLSLERIHLSSRVSRELEIPSLSTKFSSKLDKTNRAAFQSLLAKFLYSSNRLLSRSMCLAWVTLDVRAKRIASAPYCSMISIGSMTFPFDLDIFSHLYWTSFGSG